MKFLTASILALTTVGSLFAGATVHAVVSPVPEPGTLILLATGAGALLLLAKRKGQKK